MPVTVGLPLPLPLSRSVFLLSVFCAMNLFTPNKLASPPKDSDNRGLEPSVWPSPSSQTNPDLEALVRQEAAELEGLRRRLEKAELASPKTPRLTAQALADFRGRGRLAGWMKQAAESLEQYVQCNRIGIISQFCRRMRQMSRLYGDEYRLKQLLSIHIAL